MAARLACHDIPGLQIASCSTLALARWVSVDLLVSVSIKDNVVIDDTSQIQTR